MGWAPGNARWHVVRLTDQGWLDRVERPRGKGSLYFATRQGVDVAGGDIPPAPEPAPTWWLHLDACAWVAAWLTVREREMLGPRELLVHRAWQGELLGLPGRRELVHRPDLVGVVPGRRPAAVEVELRRKSKARLRAILKLHARWIAAGQSGACVYVCGDEEIRQLVLDQAALVGLDPDDGSLRLELLGAIKSFALDASNSVPRGTRTAGTIG